MRTLLFCLVAGLWVGCQKDDEAPLAEDVSMVVDHAVVSAPLVSIYPLLRAMRIGELPWDSIPGHTCAAIDSISGDTAAFPGNGPITLHLRYPDGGCTDVDGRARAGALTVTLDEVIGQAPGAFAASSDNLTVTGTKVRFALTGSVSGANGTVDLDSCFVWLSGAWALKTQGLLSYQMTAGSTTSDHTDDEYVINRTSNGLDRNGRPYVVSTSTQLRFELECPWVSEGKELILPSGVAQRLLDHGTGTCDGYSGIILNGDTVGLTIP